MPLMPEQSVEKIRRDHEYMIDLVRRIKASCNRVGVIDDCSNCHPNMRHVCHDNIEQLIRVFVEITLKHNLIESMYMEERVPQAHRIAHNQAHLDIAEQLKAIRAVFSDDGNSVVAIEGIDAALGSLMSHFEEYDRQLESYLLAPA